MSKINVNVQISGPALSLLLYENINASHDQEGFLLGTRTSSVTKSVTDDSDEQLKVRDVIHVKGILPCDVPHMYYSHNGQLIEDKLQDFLGEERKNVVAWFKYQKFRKLGFRFSLRERVLHEQLSNYLNIRSDLFPCLILTYGTTANKSTHTFRHAFISHDDCEFHIVPMNIENSSNPCHEYQAHTEPSEAFMQLYDKIDKNQSDVQIVQDVHEALQDETKKTIDKVLCSEDKLSKLREEVEELRERLRKKITISDQNEPERVESTNNDVSEPKSAAIVDLTLGDEQIDKRLKETSKGAIKKSAKKNDDVEKKTVKKTRKKTVQRQKTKSATKSNP